MKIRVLGCHGSDQLINRPFGTLSCRTCGFLVNDAVLVDAGTIGSQLLLCEQQRIQSILLTHLHFDHIKELPTLADNLVGKTRAPVQVASIPEVLTGLETHIFNDAVFPNFFRIPNASQPVFQPRVLAAGHMSLLNGLEVTPIAVNHLVPTVGFVISDGDSCFLYSGDTYQTDALWDVASRLPSLKAAFIETSFPNDMAELAAQTKHLTPLLLAEELRKLNRSEVPVYIYHMKPRFREKIVSELKQLDEWNISVLEEGQEIYL